MSTCPSLLNVAVSFPSTSRQGMQRVVLLWHGHRRPEAGRRCEQARPLPSSKAHDCSVPRRILNLLTDQLLGFLLMSSPSSSRILGLPRLCFRSCTGACLRFSASVMRSSGRDGGRSRAGGSLGSVSSPDKAIARIAGTRNWNRGGIPVLTCSASATLTVKRQSRTRRSISPDVPSPH